jgi:hypothetical protein
MDTLRNRLNRLERENRIWKAAAILALAIFALGTLMGATGSKEPLVIDEIRAKRVYIVDGEEKIRAALALVVKENVEKGVGLALYDGKGRTRASLGVSPNGSNVLLKDADGKTRATLATSQNGPAMALFDSNFNPRAALTVTENGPALRLYDANRNVFWGRP